ncbi:MAG: hypothetical protein ACJLS3_00265 [Erythrobacter sp.]
MAQQPSPTHAPPRQFSDSLSEFFMCSACVGSRSRARERIVDLPIEDLLDLIPAGGYAVSSPDEVVEQERVRQICADALDRLAANDEKRAALIDAIDQGKRGDDLALALGITKRIWLEAEVKLDKTIFQCMDWNRLMTDKI